MEILTRWVFLLRRSANTRLSVVDAKLPDRFVRSLALSAHSTNPSSSNFDAHVTVIPVSSTWMPSMGLKMISPGWGSQVDPIIRTAVRLK